jgi:two-component sensor histidine kinase
VQSEEAKGALQESVLRIGSIALVHETLSAETSDLAEFGDVARKVAQMVSDGLVLPERGVEIKVAGSTGPVGADISTPLAVTLAELLQNAIEHAFPSGRPGTVGVELSTEADELVLVVWDDGIGMSSEPLEGARLGLQILRSLIEELGGHVEISANGGTRVEVRVPMNRPLPGPDTGSRE